MNLQTTEIAAEVFNTGLGGPDEDIATLMHEQHFGGLIVQNSIDVYSFDDAIKDDSQVMPLVGRGWRIAKAHVGESQ